MHHWCDGYARAGERGPATTGFFKVFFFFRNKKKLIFNINTG